MPLELRDALVERAGGNPLYAEEFVRMLVDRGLLYRERGDWRVKSTEFPLPESVQGIIASRVDALQPDEKTALRDAAVIGRGFWPAAVAAVSGLEREAGRRSAVQLERKELVRRLSASSIASELQYSFHHAVVRDVAYSSIPRRAGAEAPARGGVDRVPGPPRGPRETIAHHYLSALEYARGARQPTDRFAEQAAKRCEPPASARSASTPRTAPRATSRVHSSSRRTTPRNARACSS